MKAMLAHEKALDWQDLFELAIQESLAPDELSSVAYRVAGMGPLSSLECARRSDSPQRILQRRSVIWMLPESSSTMREMLGRASKHSWKAATSQKRAGS